ncbi:MAG: hypothetical protein WCE90_07840, partial [Candidatus Zixiibacteriota bacterium]
MKTRLLVVAVVSCFLTGLLVAPGFPASDPQKRAASEVSKYPDKGNRDTMTCTDIAPEAGTIIENALIGDTWYDEQQIGSIGQMISLPSNGYRHFSWTYSNGAFPGANRYVDIEDESPGGGFSSQYQVTLTGKNAGYSNQTDLSDGTSVIICHQTAGSPIWYATLINEDGQYDLPDYITDAPTTNPMQWPKAMVQHDAASGRDYIHVVGTEGNTAGGAIQVVCYERCYLALNDTLICQAYERGSTKTYKLRPNVAGGGSLSPVGFFDSSCSVTIIPAVSPVSRKVAVAWIKPATYGTTDYGGDVAYMESDSLGDEWIAGTYVKHNITNYKLADTERAFSDLSACYDYKDSLHIVWSARYFDLAHPGQMFPIAKLYHWAKQFGVSLIASGYVEDLPHSGKSMAPSCSPAPCPRPDTKPGNWNATVCKPSIAAVNPIYHPDSTYLYCIWTQFNPGDTSIGGYGNGEIYGAASFNGGDCWGDRYNLTNTPTPNCTPGNCLSEHWASLAISDTTLHIQYVCDRDAGAAVQNEGSWLDNSIMYLHLTQWQVGVWPRMTYKLVSPDAWSDPPLKVPPGGSRVIQMKIYSTGCVTLQYSLSTDNACIQVSVPPTILQPKDSAAVAVILSGAGACNAKYIKGNVIVTTDEPPGIKTYAEPVEFIVAKDYYECPRDTATVDTLYNGVLKLIVNANSEEKISDSASFPDTSHNIFFDGGTIIATTVGTDTLVGRYMGTLDHRTGARDKLYTSSCTQTWEPDFYLVYTRNIYMQATHLSPPDYFKWFWWEEAKQIKMF